MTDRIPQPRGLQSPTCWEWGQRLAAFNATATRPFERMGAHRPGTRRHPPGRNRKLSN
jgi:hypothetical protein